jgi:hypothetical protein
MKNKAVATILALFLLSFATQPLAIAQTEGPAASGAYRFILADRVVKTVEFDARGDREGGASGWMTFIDQVELPDQDVDGAGDSGDKEAPLDFYVKAEFSGMTVEKNRALINGTIVDSSHRSYIGKWVQLVVEDNIEGQERPDTLTWRFCQPEPGGWIPSDAEVPGDRGALMSWWATDAERKDDVGVPSPSYIPGELKRCLNYPLSSYTFVDILKWDGDIRVLP